MPKKYLDDESRIKDNCLEDANGCWRWQLSKDNHGYGMVRAGFKGKAEKAHRYSYRIFVNNGKEIPKGVFICHTCDVRDCVNPDHLWPGNCKNNMDDASQKGRLTASRKHLTQLQIDQIRALSKEGVTKKEIADEFGVSQQTVQRYWKDSNDEQEQI